MMWTDFADLTSDSIRHEARAIYAAAPWPNDLPPPIDPADTLLCMRAQSALSGLELGQVHDLTTDQARDVLAWFNPKY